MTIPAVDPQPRDVMLMAERNRLYARYSCVVRVGRPLHLLGKPERKADEEDDGEDRCASYRVCAAMEYLAHLASLPISSGCKLNPVLQFV